MNFELLSQGRERAVYVYGSCKKLREWMLGLKRPPERTLIGLIDKLAERPVADLVRARKIWKPVTDTDPKLYEIRKDQVRLLCVLDGNDIVIVDWFEKKKPRIPQNVLRRAERRAKEVLGC